MSDRSYWRRQVGSYADTLDTPIGDVRFPEAATEENAEWFEHDCLSHGDYSGYGAIGRSNIRVLRERFAALEDVAWFEVTGHCSSHSVRFDALLERNPDHWEQGADLAEFLDGLDAYCIADENDESEVECEEYYEAWTSFGCDDFVSALARAYPHHDTDFYQTIPSAALCQAWEALNPSGEFCTHETGGASFSFDRVLSERAGMCKPSYAEVRTALRDAIFEHTRRSVCCHCRPMKGPQEVFVCCKCGCMTPGFERGETVIP